MDEKVYEIDFVKDGKRVLAITNIDLEDRRVRELAARLLLEGARMVIRDSGFTRREFEAIIEGEALEA